MEIVLPASSPLCLPPGAVGSSSKRGDGLMEQIQRPKMEPQWTNRLLMPPRAERPPIPRTRTASLCEKIEDANGNYDCRHYRDLFVQSVRDAGIAHSYINYRRSNNTLAVVLHMKKCGSIRPDRGRKDLKIRDRAFSQSE